MNVQSYATKHFHLDWQKKRKQPVPDLRFALDRGLLLSLPPALLCSSEVAPLAACFLLFPLSMLAKRPKLRRFVLREARETAGLWRGVAR